MQRYDRGERAAGKGIIVIDDAWPFTDGLCLAFLDLYTSRQADIQHIAYARMGLLPGGILEEMEASGIMFSAVTNRQEMSNEALLDAAMNAPETTGREVIILQEKAAILLFHERLTDPTFRDRIFARFGSLAVDYSLGLEFFGTDILRRAKTGARRILISANAVEHLPPDYAANCDARICKADIRIATMASMLANPDSKREGSDAGPTSAAGGGNASRGRPSTAV